MNEIVLAGYGINHSYSSVRVLLNVNIEISQNEIVGLLGKSGCGKSTLLGILSGLRHPDSGRILAADRELYIDEKTTLEMRRHTGMVFQMFNLISELTVKENINFTFRLRMGVWPSEVSTKNLLEEMDVLRLENRYPSELSMGERQRVAVARAVAGNPLLIFADEPTGSIDAENKKRVLDLFNKVRGKKVPVLMASHDYGALSVCDRIYELRNCRCQEVKL